MQLEELYIERFAGLSDLSLSFSEGLNLIEGKNESGKSSVAGFIKFLFYGVSGKGTDGAELSERARILPFDAAHVGGWATVRTDARRLKIRRSLSVSRTGSRESVRETKEICDADTGDLLFSGEEPGELLFGVGAKLYRSTAFFRQMADAAPERGEVTAAIGNILFSGDEGTDVRRAQKTLDELRVRLLHKNGKGGEIFDLREEERRLQDLLREAEESNRGVIATEGELDARREKLAALEKQEAEMAARTKAAKIRLTLACREEKRDKEAALAENRAALAALYPNGEKPDVSDLAAARRTVPELPLREEELREALETQRRLEEELASLPASEENGEEIEAAGGAERVRSEHAYLLKKKRADRLFAILFAVFGAAALAFGLLAHSSLLPFLTEPLSAGIGRPAAILGGALLLVSLFYLVGALRAAGKARSLRARICGSCGERAFGPRMDAYLDNARELRDKRLAVSAAKAKADAAKETFGALAADARRLLARLSGGDGEKEKTPDGALSAALQTAADRADERGRQAVRLDAEEAALRARIAELSRSVGPEEEDALRAELAALALPPEDPSQTIASLEQGVEFYRQQAQLQRAEIHKRELTLADLRARALDPYAVSGKLFETQTSLASAERRYRACERAIEALSEAGREIRGGVAPTLSAGACERLAAFTSGRYGALSVASDLSLSHEDKTGAHSPEQFSAGTRDLAYLSLRLALVDLLYVKEKPPLILDETLAFQDAERTRLALALLAREGERGVQSLLFTCRGEESAAGAGVPMNRIVLEGK
ncbi:MAG: AAA family ATPase [Clostridia bacterium]|nr:AAA family ATPase [Clostridia bacterium]